MTDKEDIKADDMPEKDDAKKAEKKPAPKKAKKEDEALVKNTIVINPKLEEAKGSTVVLGWGRMNPITIGHEKLVKKLQDVARKQNATPALYLTHTQNSKKDPLSYNDKIMLARKAFGSIVQKSNSKTIIQVMQELQKKYSNVVLVVGSDRVSQFEALLNKYNGKDYNFDSIDIVSAGERDPDADDVSGMSASKMRALASEGDLEAFKKGLPKKLQRNAQDVYDMVRGGLKLLEELETEGLLLEAPLNIQQRRKRAKTMRKYKNKIAAARKRAMRKAAGKPKLQNRSRKRAINIIRSKVAGRAGKSYKNLSVSQKMMIDKKVAKRKALVGRLSKRLLVKVRKADRGRGGSGRINESFDLFLESMNNPEQPKQPTKRFHEIRKKDGSVKLDGRFKIFKKKVQEDKEAVARLKATHRNERENLRREHEKELDVATTSVLRKQIRRVNAEDFNVEFESDKELLALIEEVADEIFTSVQLEESKIEKSLLSKAEKHGIEFDDVRDVYEDALDEGKTIEEAFMSVNVYLANLTPKEELSLDEAVEELFGEETTSQLIKRIKAKTISKKKYEAAAKLVKQIYDRKKAEGGTSGPKHSSGYYAAQIAKQIPGVNARILGDMVAEEHGAGDEGTDKLVKKYKKDTPAESVEESVDDIFEAQFKVEIEGLPDMFVDAKSPAEVMANMRKKLKKPDEVKNIQRVTPEKIRKHFRMIVRGDEDATDINEEVTQKQIQDLEKFADRLLDKFGVDIEFTRHFADRMNDDRNNPAIGIPELQRFFKKVAKNKAKDIKANANSEAVLNDIQADLNLPVVIKFNKDKEEFEVVNKTIMRKKNFKTPNKVIKY